ncbi:hypothetical protein M2282_003805, partial [Variovorax boronicumulans]|nr:hypothetical protein [Variovorax boronicumulans]
DSAGSRVKVGHRQALTAQKTPVNIDWGFFALGERFGLAIKTNNRSTAQSNGDQ